MEQHDSATQLATLRKIINGAHTAFFVSHTKDGRALGRPMATAELAEGVKELWFATDRTSGKVEELAADNRVFLGYSSASQWASVTGRAVVVDDREKIKALWSPIWKNWFQGPDDPKLTLIRVEPEEAEYWDGGSGIVTMAKLAFTAVTGKTVSPGEHARLKL